MVSIRVVWRYNRADDFWNCASIFHADSYMSLYFEDNSVINIPYASMLLWREN